MRTISHKNLPNSNLKSVGLIPISQLFPYETYLTHTPHAYIHYDGGLVRFFKLKNGSMAMISKIIKALPENSALQLYRYHTPGSDTCFLSLRKDIQYGESIKTRIYKKFALNPVKTSLNEVQKLTNDAYESLSTVVADTDAEEIDFLESELPGMLLDCEIKGMKMSTSSDIRANMSFLKTGKKSYATIASLNNMSVIPMNARGCIRDQSFLQRIIVASPSQERRKKLQLLTLDNAKIIQELSGETGKSRKIHVDTLTDNIESTLGMRGKTLYADVAFFLRSDSMDDLNGKLTAFSEAMERVNVALYCHTNTSKAAYISMFPGNEVYSERYSLQFEYYLNMLIMNVLEL